MTTPTTGIRHSKEQAEEIVVYLEMMSTGEIVAAVGTAEAAAGGVLVIGSVHSPARAHGSEDCDSGCTNPRQLWPMSHPYHEQAPAPKGAGTNPPPACFG